MATENYQAPQPKVIRVPEGGHKIFNFELTPNTLNSCNSPWELIYINKNGTRTSVSTLTVSFSEDSTPPEMAEEYALILVTLSASAQAAKWQFIPSVVVYEDGLVAGDSITTDLAYRIVAMSEGQGGHLSYGIKATLNGVTYTEPDPRVVVGRP